MPCFYLTPKQDDFNKIPELQVCIAEALYDVDSIVADPGAYTKEELAALHSQIVSNLEQAWEISGGSEDQLTDTLIQISQGVARDVEPCIWLSLMRNYNVGQDIVGLLIEIPEPKRRSVSLSSYDFGWQTAVCGLSPAANLKY